MKESRKGNAFFRRRRKGNVSIVMYGSQGFPEMLTSRAGELMRQQHSGSCSQETKIQN
jgi:hypothetical protein